MSLTGVSHLIVTYRYGILIPLSLAEGPIVSFIAGTLAALGYFNIWVLAAIFFVRDIGMDAVYYSVGYFGWQNLSVERLLAKIHIREEQLDEVKDLWSAHPFRTVLAGKLSYGLAVTFIMVVGMVKIPLMKFYKYSVWVTMIEFGTLLTLGYFFGNEFGGDLAGTVRQVLLAIGAAAAIVLLHHLLGRHMRRRLLRTHEAAGTGRTEKAS